MEREHAPGRFLPYPELVETGELEPGDEAPYKILNSCTEPAGITGAVDKVARRMLVPLEPYGRPTSRHELAHVRYSPRRPAAVRFDRRVLASVEDARVNLALAARGVPLELGPEAELHVAWLLAADQKRGDVLAVWLRTIACIGTSAEPMVSALLASWRDGEGERVIARAQRIREKLEEARKASGLEAAPEPRGRALARELARVLRAEGVLDARGRSASEYKIDCCTVHDGDEDEHARRRGREDAEQAEGVAKPGRMRVTRALLTRARTGGLGPRAWRAAREGSVVRYPQRWPFDRAIFRQRARQSRGTVLVDVSGSMSLKPADLDRMLASTRTGLVVAIYSGKGDEGELRVIADGARRAADAQLKSFGSGNIVDLPALGWLARQPAPRLWVSDGGVTGMADQPSRALKEQCFALCKRSRIRRVAKLDEVAAFVGAAPSVARRRPAAPTGAKVDRETRGDGAEAEAL